VWSRWAFLGLDGPWALKITRRRFLLTSQG
jgi:hypothetical protein